MTPDESVLVFTEARRFIDDLGDNDRRRWVTNPVVRRFDIALIDAIDTGVTIAELARAADVAPQTVAFWRARAIDRWGDGLDIAPRDLARSHLCIGCLAALIGASKGLWCSTCWRIAGRCGVLADRLRGGKALRPAPEVQPDQPDPQPQPEPRPVRCGLCGKGWRECQGCGLRQRVADARTRNLGGMVNVKVA